MATKIALQYFKALQQNTGIAPKKDTTNENWQFLGGGSKLNASDIFYDDSNLQLNVTNVQQAIESLSSRIPLFFDVYPEDNGTFDDAKRPANYYKTLYNVTTVWKKRFGNTGAFTRYQGGNSNEDRSGVIPSGSEIRAINILKETWELVSINNINIQDLLKS